MTTSAPGVSRAANRPFTAFDLDGSKKVAALLLAMGKPLASRVLKHFDADDIRAVIKTTSALGSVPRSILDQLVEEFAQSFAIGSDVQGSIGEAEQLLEGVVPAEQFEEIMSDVRGLSTQAIWMRLTELPENSVAQYLSKEHPQVAALVLSKTTPACAAAIIAQLPPTLRNEVMRRMLSIAHVMETPLQTLEETLREDLLAKVSRGKGPNIHARIADIINKLERQHMDEVLESLHQHRPKEAKIVRGLLFTFDDILKLSDVARTKLFDQVPPERTILALRGADPHLTSLILACVSSRSRRMIEQELASPGQIVAKEVVKARRAIADLALDMGERGLIEINSQEE